MLDLMQPLGMVCLYCDGVFVFELKRGWRGVRGEARGCARNKVDVVARAVLELLLVAHVMQLS